MKNELKDLFENKLDLDKNLKEYVMHPYTTMEDYIKYGNMFLKLELRECE